MSKKTTLVFHVILKTMKKIVQNFKLAYLLFIRFVSSGIFISVHCLLRKE